MRQSAKSSNFNPRSPHGERHAQLFYAFRIIYFNPRSPHGERQSSAAVDDGVTIFQSTLPARGATWKTVPIKDRDLFQSTLPARGATAASREIDNWLRDFNPRSPHGERRIKVFTTEAADNFNPRSPHGERPKFLKEMNVQHIFQSTLPARGATDGEDGGCCLREGFQSTLPARGATVFFGI